MRKLTDALYEDTDWKDEVESFNTLKTGYSATKVEVVGNDGFMKSGSQFDISNSIQSLDSDELIIQNIPDASTLTYSPAGFATNNSLIVMTGGDDFHTSTDGINWTLRTHNGDSSGEIVYAEGYFITPSSPGEIYYSSDGISWNTLTVPSGGSDYYDGIGYGNGQFICPAANGYGALSSNGTSWSRITIKVGSDMQDAAFGNGVWVAVGGLGSIATSTNGTSWTTRTSGTSKTLNRVTFANGYFVAVGYDGTIITSTNGTSWTTNSSISSKYPTDRFLFIENYEDTWITGCKNGVLITAENPTGTWTEKATKLLGDDVDEEIKCCFYSGSFWLVGTSRGTLMKFDDFLPTEVWITCDGETFKEYDTDSSIEYDGLRKGYYITNTNERVVANYDGELQVVNTQQGIE